MASRPVVRKTYGKAPPRSSSSVSLYDASSPPPPSLAGPSSSAYRSSSPAFDRLDSPLGSSPPRDLREREGTPLFFSCDEDEVEETRPSRDAGQEKEQALKAKGKAPVKVVKKAETQSSLKGFFAPLPKPKKRPLEPSPVYSLPSPTPSSMLGLSRPTTARKFIKTPTPTSSAPGKENRSIRKPVQMRLTHLPLLHTCPQCGMSFMRGGEDEAVHRVHHTRVLRGILWEGAKVKGKGKGGEEGWKVVADDVEFGEGRGKGRGRIVVVDGSVGGPKMNEILSTVDLVLSAPALPPSILAQCKIFLFLTSSPPPPPPEATAKRQKLDPTLSKANKDGKERVISVVVAQGIKWAMRVLRDGEGVEGKEKVVETGGFGSVSCEPTPLPTPLGIHRLYTIPSYRSHHLSTHLLNAACAHTVYGCELDPKKGQVAFSQPTESGRKMMERWGGGEVRVFVDDESQI
ncbi:hypothetical protein IAR50_003335 [Cryptococcus sp. DSM 104548]